MLDSAQSERCRRPGAAFPESGFALPRLPATSFHRLALVLALVASLGLVACGGEPAGLDATPTPTPTPQELLTRTSSRLAETPAVKFTLDIEGDTFVDPNRTIRLLAATGNLLRPDRVWTEFQAEVLGRAITLQLITIADQTWLTNILTGAWGPAPVEFAYRPDVLFDTQNGIGPVMGRVDSVERLPDEELDGQSVYRLRAEVADSVIGPLTYYTLKGSPVIVDLWIDRESDNLLRARISEPKSAERPNAAVWTLNLFDHGDEVAIEPPPLATPDG